MIVRRHSLVGFFVGNRWYQFCDHFAKIFCKIEHKREIEAVNWYFCYNVNSFQMLKIKLAIIAIQIVQCSDMALDFPEQSFWYC